MRHPFAFLLVAFLVGCVMTPDEVRRDGRIYMLDSTLPPSRAAACIARTFESARNHLDLINDWHTTSVRDGQQPGAMEVVVYDKLGEGFRFTYIDVFPSQTGSMSKISFQPRLIPDYLQDEMFSLLKKKCHTGEH